MSTLAHQIHRLRELHRKLLPADLPRREGWSFAAHAVTGGGPGCAYYDVVSLPDGRLNLLMADASEDEPTAPALLAMLRVLLHSCPLSSGEERLPYCPLRQPVLQPPHVLFAHLNRLLAENTLADQFLTAFCLVLDPFDGNLHYTNAGHPLPRLWRAETRKIEPLREVSGLPLGVNAGTIYHRRWDEMRPGDVLVLFGGDLIEAVNLEGRPFGVERLDEAIMDAAEEGAEAVKDEIAERFLSFMGRARACHDLLFLVVARG